MNILKENLFLMRRQTFVQETFLWNLCKKRVQDLGSFIWEIAIMMKTTPVAGAYQFFRNFSSVHLKNLAHMNWRYKAVRFKYVIFNW